ncbi:thioesterase superfamily protein [Actinocorallia herbida]|uniref:Acyl-coenzyme A thioesterase THEM4 n=1 Tax=Actinocorallia herbida TaxID=58109 RepID=A0A3N1DA62_9ACTN|nr:PaaI family thioesterase [Actinocorallia herbida]ROO90411.1 thioesterase superfamily protein [Actinocorallia herbida]
MTASPATTPPPGARIPTQDLGLISPDDLRSAGIYDGCFGCGKDVADGLQVERTSSDGTFVHGHFHVGDRHQGAPGLAHGGLLATAMDEILGTAAWSLGRMAVTGRLETDYRMPVPVGSTVYLKAWCTGVEGRKIYLRSEGRLNDPDGPIAVEAAALFVEVPAVHFTQER